MSASTKDFQTRANQEIYLAKAAVNEKAHEIVALHRKLAQLELENATIKAKLASTEKALLGRVAELTRELNSQTQQNERLQELLKRLGS
jgi:hypothetical protein